MKVSHDVVAVFDVSSSSVAGAHVLMQKDSATILASARVNAPLQEDMEIKRFVDDTVKHLEEVVSHIRATDVHHPSHIQVVLASPWYSAQTRTIVYKKETPFTCTQKLVNDLVKAEIDHVISSTEGSFGVFGKESVIIEQQISGITLNGYQTDAPYGKRADTLELALTVTIAPKPVLDRFTDTLRRVYGTRTISCTTSPVATFVVLRDRSQVPDDCVIIDVGEEVTDVAFVKAGIVLYQHSFPVGTYGLYRALAGSGKHTLLETSAMLESHRLGKLSPQTGVLVDTAMAAFSKEWQAGLRTVLDGGTFGFCMPAKCVIVVDPRFEALLVQSIKDDPFIQHSCSYSPVDTRPVTEAMIGTEVHMQDHASFDIPLATGALFARRVM